MKRPTLPTWALLLLRVSKSERELEDIIGDLEEVYLHRLTQFGKFRVNLWLLFECLSLTLSYGLENRRKQAAYSPFYQQNTFPMFKNYAKIAIRNFGKHKLFTFLNVLGLALGMSLCLLALSIAVAIYQTDGWQQNKDRIYQINTHLTDETGGNLYASTYRAIGPNLEEQYPFVDEVVRFYSAFSPTIDHYGSTIDIRGYYADPSFFDAFSFELYQGDRSTALSEPNTIVLTHSTATLLFREENPIGKALETDLGTFTVTGVMEDLKQTHLYFQGLASYSTYENQLAEESVTDDWLTYRNHYIYLMLEEGTDEQQLTKALAQVAAEAQHFHPNQQVRLESVQLDEVVPRWDISNAIGIGWDQASMIFFMVMGLLILLPAVFNYTNLSIARSLQRAKEIGVRKVVGAEKGQIQSQFVVETLLITLIALLGSIVIFVPIKKEFLSMVIAAEVLDTSMGATQTMVFLLFAILVGIGAGIFPARYFARFNPIDTMKGKISHGVASASTLKKGLFVFQFVLSLVFMIGVGAIARQHAYVLNENHGFVSDNMLTVPFKGMDKQIALQELSKHPDIKAVTSSSHLPGLFLSEMTDVTTNQQDTMQTYKVFVGDMFIQNLNMNLVWGESESLSTSTQNEELVLVNEQFMQAQRVFNQQTDSLTFTLMDGTKCRIVGILENFNFEPLNRTISPLMFRYSLAESNYALLTINSSNIKRTINDLEKIWEGIDQEATMEAKFLDDEIEEAYYFLSSQIKVFGFLSAMAITISCLGLLGMVSHTTENRTKEIAIRKILGASNGSLYYLLTKDFVKLILIAASIAVPFSYFFYDKVFLYFLIRYGSGIGFLEIVASILFLFFIGFISIHWKASRVAKADPAGNLRYE